MRVTGLTLEVVGCQLIMGQRCEVETATGAALLAEVVGFNRDISYLMPLQPMSGLYAGARVLPVDGEETIRVGEHLLGRVVDGLLQPLDGRPLKEEGTGSPASLPSQSPVAHPGARAARRGHPGHQWPADGGQGRVWDCLPVPVWARACCSA